MVRIDIPERLTQKNLLSLLEEKAPRMRWEEIDDIDFIGKDAKKKENDVEKALAYRMLAAVLYQERDLIFRAAYSYDHE